jgi:type II secretory pathway pseudopilin PulG
MPGVQIEEQASYAGSIVVLTIVVFIAGMALFAWLSIRNTDRRIESKSRKQDL